MPDEREEMDLWLHKKVSWMVKETSHYFDTRELLGLCQTVALMNLNDTLKQALKQQGDAKKK